MMRGAGELGPRFNTDGALVGMDGRPIAVEGVPYKKKAGSYLSGRQSTLNPFPFESLYGNGQIYTAAQMQTTHAAGITGLLERVTDSSINASTTSEIPPGDLCAWKLSVQPSHLVTFGRPRTQLIGKDLEMYTPYRMSWVLRLDQISTAGWNNKATKMPLACLFALSQQGDFSAGQLAAAASPLYLVLRGSMLYWELRTIAEEMGLAPGDANTSTTYTRWNFGDTIRTSRKYTPTMVMSGAGYHHVVLDFFLDERRLKAGGRGYFKAYFDGKPWFNYVGATAMPANSAGQFVPIMDRPGFYEVNGASLAADKLCSEVNACSVARSILFQSYSCEKA